MINRGKLLITGIVFIISFMMPFSHQAQAQNVILTIHLRGVYNSDISLLALTPAQTFKPVLEVKGISGGQSAKLEILNEYLPGEFVIRFDYRETGASAPYPSEKYIFAFDQDLELWVSPMFCNNADSTFFQEDERENKAFTGFSAENALRREKLGLLQNFLMSYDDAGSDFYKEGIKEYENRRKDYNSWLDDRAELDKSLFVSNIYVFQFVPQITWTGSETDRLNSLIEHYFDGTDFKDSLMVKTSDINKWMDNYVNLYGQQVTSMDIRDSLFALAGTTAINKTKFGHPKVYGWMVDYFYRGYETNGIDAGIKILEPYLDDPNCLTGKRQEILRRLKGIETLLPGTKAPDISMTDPNGGLFNLYEYGTGSKYLLIFFWSADCEHCAQMTASLYPWQQQEDIREKLMVLAVSLDETETELAAWKQKITQLQGWKHLNAPDGVRSMVAFDYFILATPVMLLLDAATKEIVDMPATLEELKAAVD
jgi:hypothetical protein